MSESIKITNKSSLNSYIENLKPVKTPQKRLSFTILLNKSLSTQNSLEKLSQIILSTIKISSPKDTQILLQDTTSSLTLQINLKPSYTQNDQYFLKSQLFFSDHDYQKKEQNSRPIARFFQSFLIIFTQNLQIFTHIFQLHGKISEKFSIDAFFNENSNNINDLDLSLNFQENIKILENLPLNKLNKQYLNLYIQNTDPFNNLPQNSLKTIRNLLNIEQQQQDSQQCFKLQVQHIFQCILQKNGLQVDILQPNQENIENSNDMLFISYNKQTETNQKFSELYLNLSWIDTSSFDLSHFLKNSLAQKLKDLVKSTQNLEIIVNFGLQSNFSQEKFSILSDFLNILQTNSQKISLKSSGNLFNFYQKIQNLLIYSKTTFKKLKILQQIPNFPQNQNQSLNINLPSFLNSLKKTEKLTISQPNSLKININIKNTVKIKQFTLKSPEDFIHLSDLFQNFQQKNLLFDKFDLTINGSNFSNQQQELQQDLLIILQQIPSKAIKNLNISLIFEELSQDYMLYNVLNWTLKNVENTISICFKNSANLNLNQNLNQIFYDKNHKILHLQMKNTNIESQGCISDIFNHFMNQLKNELKFVQFTYYNNLQENNQLNDQLFLDQILKNNKKFNLFLQQLQKQQFMIWYSNNNNNAQNLENQAIFNEYKHIEFLDQQLFKNQQGSQNISQKELDFFKKWQQNLQYKFYQKFNGQCNYFQRLLTLCEEKQEFQLYIIDYLLRMFNAYQYKFRKEILWEIIITSLLEQSPIYNY